MKKRSCYFATIILLLLAATAFYLNFTQASVEVPESYITIDTSAAIRPDYTQITIPPNIAPLNFVIGKPGSAYYVKIYSEQGKSITVSSRSAKIIIPEAPWQKLLEDNRGKELYFDVYVKNGQNKWQKSA